MIVLNTHKDQNNILKALPMDEIKLDRFFIKRGNYPERDTKVLTSIITLAKDLKMKVTQEVVDEAVKKSDLPASATIFISSTSGKENAAEKTNKTRIELVGSGEMRSWIGIKHHEEDNAFLKEANVAEKGTRMIYESDDTLFVVVGEPRAISKMLLNGKDVPLPEMKFGRVVRFRVFAGEIVKTKGGR